MYGGGAFMLVVICLQMYGGGAERTQEPPAARAELVPQDRDVRDVQLLRPLPRHRGVRTSALRQVRTTKSIILLR